MSSTPDARLPPTAGLILLVAGIVLFALGVMLIAIGGRRQVTIREDVHSTGQGRSGFRSGVTPVLS